MHWRHEMTLNYLKEDSLSSRLETVTAPVHQKSRRKFSKLKFFTLLVLNLFVWVFIGSFYLDCEITPTTIKQTFREYTKGRGLVVTGVVCNSKMQAAIISNEIYYVGDAVKGFTITAITQNGVEFRRGQKKLFKKVTSL